MVRCRLPALAILNGFSVSSFLSVVCLPFLTLPLSVAVAGRSALPMPFAVSFSTTLKCAWRRSLSLNFSADLLALSFGAASQVWVGDGGLRKPAPGAGSDVQLTDGWTATTANSAGTQTGASIGIPVVWFVVATTCGKPPAIARMTREFAAAGLREVKLRFAASGAIGAPG